VIAITCTHKEAAAMLGYKYNRYHILREMGALRLIKTVRYAKNTRERVIKATVEEQIKHSVVRS
jgi:hypothetical protein